MIVKRTGLQMIELPRKSDDDLPCFRIIPAAPMRPPLPRNLQTPIAAPIYRVVYLKEGKERWSPRLYREEHARAALRIIQERYGKRNAIIYVD